MRQRGQAPTQAKDYIAAPTGATMVSDMDVPQGNERVLKSTGNAKNALDDHGLIKVMSQPYDDEKMAMLAFMNEEITIQIGQTTDKNAAQIFEININGKCELFRRGETKTVKRYFVDRMLRLKETHYDSKEVTNAEGVKDIINVPRTGMKYDFAIVNDQNPLGRSWQMAVMAEMG